MRNKLIFYSFQIILIFTLSCCEHNINKNKNIEKDLNKFQKTIQQEVSIINTQEVIKVDSFLYNLNQLKSGNSISESFYKKYLNISKTDYYSNFEVKGSHEGHFFELKRFYIVYFDINVGGVCSYSYVATISKEKEFIDKQEIAQNCDADFSIAELFYSEYKIIDSLNIEFKEIIEKPKNEKYITEEGHLLSSIQRDTIEFIKEIKIINVTIRYLGHIHLTNNRILERIDSIPTFIVDDYPITDSMLRKASYDKERKHYNENVLFNNQNNEVIVFQLHTDNFRMNTFHFFINDIPKYFINKIGFYYEDGKRIPNNLINNNTDLFMSENGINNSYFISNKKFKLGNNKEKIIITYGEPDSINFINDIEIYYWNFVGDVFYDGIEDLKGRPLAKNNYGHQVIICFRNNKINGILLQNKIP